MKVRARGFGTVANIASGFDLLGLCLTTPYDEVVAERRSEKGVSISVKGAYGAPLPVSPSTNTAGVAAQFILAKVAADFGVNLELHKYMPLGSGLGSSAASAAAAAVAVNALLPNPLPKEELLPAVVEAERVACGAAHADNAAPSLLGGVIFIKNNSPLSLLRLPFSSELSIAVIHPHIELKTEHSRAVLKREIPLRTVIQQQSFFGSLLLGFERGDLSLLRHGLSDIMIEPQRASIIPVFSAVKEAALVAGALGCSISGSGPSVFAIAPSKELCELVAREMAEAFRRAGLTSDIFVSSINREGASIIS